MRILPTDVPVAIEASLQKNGRKRTETQRFITDRYDRFLFEVSQLQSAVRSGLVQKTTSNFRSTGKLRNGSVHIAHCCLRTSPRTPRSSQGSSSSPLMLGSDVPIDGEANPIIAKIVSDLLNF